jgi:hypothetical protein
MWENLPHCPPQMVERMWRTAIALMGGNRARQTAGWRRKKMAKTLQENLARQLSDSVDRLHKQVEKVEFWASAMTGLAAPVPDYEPEATKVARYLKPGRPARRRRRRGAVNQNGSNSAKPASA